MPETRIIKLESSHYNSWVRLYKKYAESHVAKNQIDEVNELELLK